ncbi:MAG: LemA family protein, partial [Planctomycetota bacterium]
GIQASSLLEKTLSRLVALAEEYPDLKATQSIQDLIKEASNTEDRIADAKKEYNKECEVYNQYLSVFPGNVFAFVYRFKTLPYIGLEEDLKVPVIDLKMREPEAFTEEELMVSPNNSDKAEGAKE